MSTIIPIILIGISLSMDAFSLSLLYGTQPLTKKNIYTLSLIVGTYHFIMPLLGQVFGNYLSKYLAFNLNILVSLIFIFIAIEMIISVLKPHEEKIYLNILGYLIFGLSVSIDSFTTGIGLNIINNNKLEVSSIFALISATFTYFGLKLGNRLNKKFGDYATLTGAVMLIILSIYYYVK